MVRKTAWVCCVLISQIAWASPQQNVLLDSVRSNGRYQLVEFHLNIPVGQTFIQRTHAPGYSHIKAVMPKQYPLPVIKTTTKGNTLVTDFSCNNKSNRQIATATGSSCNSYQFSSANTLVDYSKMLWELNPDPEVPVALNMDLGYGATRLDLSDLNIRKLNVTSGASNVIITYTKPNRSDMEQMDIEAGMSTIVLRNIEFAKARNIRVANAMGKTKVILGHQCPTTSNIHIEVGAGSAVLMTSEKMPVRIVLDENLLSEITIPVEFTKNPGNIYVNKKYQSDPTGAVTFYVDLGVGKLEVIPMN